MRILTIPVYDPASLEVAKRRARTGKAYMFQALAAHTWLSKHESLFQQSIIIDPQGRQITLKQATRLYERMVRELGPVRIFARPCPLVPCHGFVDSRVVSSASDILQVVKETVKADPNGEVILMPFIEAKYSAVQVGEYVTLGIGHDGVTAGKGQKVTLPASILPVDVSSKTFRTQRWHQDQIGMYQPHMYEMVVAERNGELRWHVVQARAVKPDVENAGSKGWGWFSKHVTCFPWTFYSILDSRSWNHSKLMSVAKATPIPDRIYVVDSMASHGACLFIEHNHSVITFDKIQSLCPDQWISGNKGKGVTVDEAPAPITEPMAGMLDILAARFASELGKPIRKSHPFWIESDWVNLASTTAKSAREIGASDNPRLMMVLGEGLAYLFRLSVTACIGEARHAWRHGWGLALRGKPLLRLKPSDAHPIPAGDRNSIYAEQLDNPSIANLLRNLAAADALFAMQWHGNAFGGPKWHTISQACIALYDAIRAKDWARIWPTANQLSMLTHNGGSGPLAKFSSDTTASIETVITSYFREEDNTFDKEFLPRYRPCPDLKKHLLEPGEVVAWPDGQYRCVINFAMYFSRPSGLRKLQAVGFSLYRGGKNTFPSLCDPVAHRLAIGRFKEWDKRQPMCFVSTAGEVIIEGGRPTKMIIEWQHTDEPKTYTIPPTWQLSSPRSDFYLGIVAQNGMHTSSLVDPKKDNVYTDYTGVDLVMEGYGYASYLQYLLDELKETPERWMMSGDPWSCPPPLARAGQFDEDEDKEDPLEIPEKATFSFEDEDQDDEDEENNSCTCPDCQPHHDSCTCFKCI